MPSPAGREPADGPPRLNLAAVLRLRDRLYEGPLLSLSGCQPDSAELQRLVAAARPLLPGVSRDALYETLRPLAGRPASAAELLSLAWRIAGNLPALRSGRPAMPWSGQAEPEWAPLQVLKASPSQDRKGRRGYEYTLRALAGTACPLRITAFWHRSLCSVFSRQLGFSAPWGRYPYHSGLELVGLRLYGLLEPERSKAGPGFHRIAVPPSLAKWNREEVLKVRCRAKPCPRGYTHPCRLCAVGYEECPAAVHRRTYVLQGCLDCGESEACFDPDLGMERCKDCAQRRLNQLNQAKL